MILSPQEGKQAGLNVTPEFPEILSSDIIESSTDVFLVTLVPNDEGRDIHGIGEAIMPAGKFRTQPKLRRKRITGGGHSCPPLFLHWSRSAAIAISARPYVITMSGIVVVVSRNL